MNVGALLYVCKNTLNNVHMGTDVGVSAPLYIHIFLFQLVAMPFETSSAGLQPNSDGLQDTIQQKHVLCTALVQFHLPAAAQRPVPRVDTWNSGRLRGSTPGSVAPPRRWTSGAWRPSWRRLPWRWRLRRFSARRRKVKSMGESPILEMWDHSN